MRKLFLKLIVVFFLFFSLSLGVKAAEYKTDYQVEYDLRNFEKDQLTKVNFHIQITNLRSDVYVSRFSISFPSSFYISDINVFDDNGQISPRISTDSDFIKIDMDFNNPKIGKETVNNLYLNFNQKKLFQITGNVWEVILPTIEKKPDDNYQIKVILPANSNKKISISKPKPDLISHSEIIWNNPKTKTIYAVFGETQIYKTELVYNLKNKEVYPVIQEIALPPDTLYQKVYLEFLSEVPIDVYQDEDGNFLVKYLLKPFELKKITFKGYIQTFSKPRENIIEFDRSQIKNQKKYLLSPQPFWSIKNTDKIKDLKTVEDIYYFVVNNLQYNYNKLRSNNLRLGAEKILSNPNYAVCLEFTDLFVSIAREKGILAREINGYGFSLDPKLQPISLSSDVLHAWPEYYDENLGIWQPVDPTWENTSGIDYFSSFDLNHLVFVIHGKSSEYPLPAGTYKISDSKDIIINPVIDLPKEIKKITISDFNFYKNKDNFYQIKITVKNEGNVYLYNLPIEIKTKTLIVNNNDFNIRSLAPLEKKEVIFNVEKPNKFSLSNNQEKILILSNNKVLLEQKVKIPFISEANIKIIFFIILFIVILFFVRKYFKKYFI
ncbi:MAG: hypothetical protein KatS3mg092_0106 [Patescibacteria group bacterium]|nr:MAG: hypothetical protein KatS3mg092_0106 [Patescibacteria group bacterium]